MIHLYALAATPPPDELSPGVDDVAPVVHAAGPLHAVVSEHDRTPATTAANALAHAQVVADVADRTACLPVRFGTHHLDVPALRAALADVEATALAALAEIGDGVEFVVRTSPGASMSTAGEAVPEDPDGSPGRRYLESRLAEQRAAEAASAAIRARIVAATDPLVTLARSVTERVGRHGPERCFLVPRAAAASFVTEARAATAGTDLVLGGPWPPFTFAEEALR